MIVLYNCILFLVWGERGSERSERRREAGGAQRAAVGGSGSLPAGGSAPRKYITCYAQSSCAIFNNLPD